MRKQFIKYFVNPIIWRWVKGSKRYVYLRELEKKQWRPLEKNVEEQKEKLYALVKHCHKNVPYYKKIIEEKNISYTKKTILEDIKQFPVLTKSIIRKNFDELQDQSRVKNAFKNTSGGSTGEPVVFYQDREFQDRSYAFSILCYKWAGREEGDYMIKLWGDEREILKDAKGIDWYLIRHLKNIEVLNSFKMSQENMRRYVNVINKKKPVVVESYVQSIYELAKFIKENKLTIHSPKGIITSAGTLYPEMKKEMQKVFKCEVFNRYGSREVGDVAMNCEENKGLHVNILNHHLEILDANHKLAKPESLGKVHVTPLNNYVMPMIRYEIGDIATPSRRKTCTCKRGLPLIKTVEGREMSMFKTRKGDLIPGEFFIHFLGVVFNKEYISKIQMIQKDYELIQIKAVLRNKKLFEKNKHSVEKSIKKVMGEDCEIKWKFVKDILPLKNGKYLYTISEVKK